MSTIHIVKKGECLSSIAYHYMLPDWHIIYDHPQNAEFKAKRPNPNLIYPGDELYIPDPTGREETHPTDLRHIFELKLPPTYVNICIQNEEEEAIADAPFELKVNAFTLAGNTDGDGWIRGKIPAWAEIGDLKVWPVPGDTENFISWEVRLGHLDPLETISGIKGRLNNLGYYYGEVDELEDEEYDAAVRQFQQDNGLVIDGIVGPKTRGELKKDHRV